MKTIIVDDENSSIEYLTGLITKIPLNIQIAGHAHSIEAAYNLIVQQKPDVVLLDIKIGKETGFQLLEKLPNIAFKLIFVTAYSEFALQAIKFSALDYLLKPISSDDLHTAFQKASHAIHQDKLSQQIQILLNYNTANNQEQKIALATSEQIHFIALKHIIRFKGERNYTKVFLTSDQQILLSKTLKEFELQLQTHGFIRINKSDLINKTKIKSYSKKDGGTITTDDNYSALISVLRKDHILETIFKQTITKKN